MHVYVHNILDIIVLNGSFRLFFFYLGKGSTIFLSFYSNLKNILKFIIESKIRGTIPVVRRGWKAWYISKNLHRKKDKRHICATDFPPEIGRVALKVVSKICNWEESEKYADCMKVPCRVECSTDILELLWGREGESGFSNPNNIWPVQLGTVNRLMLNYRNLSNQLIWNSIFLCPMPTGAREMGSL